MSVPQLHVDLRESLTGVGSFLLHVGLRDLTHFLRPDGNIL